jgi:hypothetical protein
MEGTMEIALSDALFAAALFAPPLAVVLGGFSLMWRSNVLNALRTARPPSALTDFDVRPHAAGALADSDNAPSTMGE